MTILFLSAYLARRRRYREYDRLAARALEIEAKGRATKAEIDEYVDFLAMGNPRWEDREERAYRRERKALRKAAGLRS